MVKKQKDKLVIKSWEHMKLLFNEDRARIVDICSLTPYSIKELAIEMDLNPGSIHNHVTKLYKANYLMIAETREINGITEKKYLRSAKYFNFAKLDGGANTTRNKHISNEIKKESFKLIENDNLTIARMTRGRLSKKNYQEARKRLYSLIEFIKDNNEVGKNKICMITCLGEVKK
jgi:predicted ArsR family transcriptional regulator